MDPAFKEFDNTHSRCCCPASSQHDPTIHVPETQGYKNARTSRSCMFKAKSCISDDC